MANWEGGRSEGSFNTIPPFGIPDPTDKAWFCSRNWAANFLIAFSGILSSNLSENTDSEVNKFNFIIIRGTSHKPNKEKHGNLFDKISICFQLKMNCEFSIEVCYLTYIRGFETIISLRNIQSSTVLLFNRSHWLFLSTVSRKQPRTLTVIMLALFGGVLAPV